MSPAPALAPLNPLLVPFPPPPPPLVLQVCPSLDGVGVGGSHPRGWEAGGRTRGGLGVSRLDGEAWEVPAWVG